MAVITASPRRVIGKERVLSADPSRVLIQSLSYEMRTKWTIFQACKYVTNGSAGTIDSNHDDTMLHSQTRLCLYKGCARWAAKPCMTGSSLDRPLRRFLSVCTSTLRKSQNWNALPFIFTVKECCWVTVNLRTKQRSRNLPRSQVIMCSSICFLVASSCNRYHREIPLKYMNFETADDL